MEVQDFVGKVALITGAGSGMGRTAAHIFAQRGAKVAAADIDRAAVEATAESVRAAGGEALALRMDVSDARSVEAGVAEVVERFGGLDFLLNFAAFYEPRKSVLEQTEEEWDRIVDVTLKGSFLTCKYAMAQMVRQGRGGAVVNISSTVGLRGCPGFVAYTAAKAGVLGLTRAAAADGAPYSIRVNAIAPGVTLTPANPRFLEVPRDSPAFREREQELPHLLKRIAEPEEIVNVAAFLCSNQASFVTGATLPVDGGWTAAV